MSRLTDRPLEHVSHLSLEYLIGGKADPVLDALQFEIPTHPRLRKGGVATKCDAFGGLLVARYDWLEHRFLAVGAMHVARTKRASFQIATLIEDEERMVARAAEVPVPDAALLRSMRWADARIQIKLHAAASAAFRNLVDPMAGQIAKRCEILRACQPIGFEPAHLPRRRARPFRYFFTDDPAQWLGYGVNAARRRSRLNTRQVCRRAIAATCRRRRGARSYPFVRRPEDNRALVLGQVHRRVRDTRANPHRR